MATFYLDLENGNDANAGTSWALAWKTFTSGATAARIAPGDEIRVAKSSDPTSIGNATWTSRSATVTLATAQTTNIYLDGAWTAANSATSTTTTTRKEGSNAASITTAATTATSTKYAYLTIGGGAGVDFSSYDAITFWIRSASVAISANNYQIKLCSDTLGDTAVDTFDIPATAGPGLWIPMTLKRNGGGALGNSIQSIAWYTGSSSPGNSRNVFIDNVSGCDFDGLNLTSLISKNSTADFTLNEGWWVVGSINGTTVTLGGTNDLLPTAYRGYYTEGTSPETVTTYIRKTIKTTMAASSGDTVFSINDSGSAGSPITFSGGWDTATTTRNGITFMDGQNGNGTCLLGNVRNYITLEYFGFVRYTNAFTNSQGYNDVILQNMYACGSSNSFSIFSTASTVNNLFCTTTPLSTSNAAIATATISNVTAYSSNTTGVTASGVRNNYSNILSSFNITNGATLGANQGNIDTITTKYNASNGLNLSGIVGNVYSLTSTNNTNYGLEIVSGASININNYISSSNLNSIRMNGSTTDVKINNYTYSETTPVIYGTNVYGFLGADYINGSPIGTLYTNYGTGTTNTFTAFQQTTTRYTASGYAWQCNVLNSIHNASLPGKITVAKIAVNSGSLVTVKAWVKLTHATNISASLVVPKLTIQGVSSNVVANKTSDTNWEELTVTFTPTVTGVAEIEFWTWSTTGSTTNSSYIDSMTITQA